MTPQERQLVDELFDRLSRLESSVREPDAERAIADGLRRAPNATYALVQTVLVQDETLKRAEARIQELESGSADRPPSGSFLDSMRDALLGPAQSRGSVPSISAANGSRGPVWNSGNVLGQGEPRQGGPGANSGAGFNNGPVGGGGSFLGTAAAAAAGMIGGSILMNSMRGMMGGHQQSFGDTSSSVANKSPWESNSTDKLSRDAGIDDIGKSGDPEQRQNFADHASNDVDNSQDDDDDDDFDADDADDAGGGDSDFA